MGSSMIYAYHDHTGASTSMFLAAELNNGLELIRRYMARGGENIPLGFDVWKTAMSDSRRVGACAWLSDITAPFPRITCVGFGMPPCVSEVSADLQLLVTVSHPYYYNRELLML